MRIVCPSCSAAYDVPDGLLLAHKAVRCVRCGQDWQPVDPTPIQAPEPPAAASVPIAPPPAAPPAPRPAPRPAIVETPMIERRVLPAGPLAIDRLMTPPAPRRAGLGLRLAWLASIALVVAALGAAYVWRIDVMAAWPPSARLYAALGLAR